MSAPRRPPKPKPVEVKILAQVGDSPVQNELFTVMVDGVRRPLTEELRADAGAPPDATESVRISMDELMAAISLSADEVREQLLWQARGSREAEAGQ